MSNKVQDFIGLWNDKHSLKALMDSDLSAKDPEDLRIELEKLDPDARKEAEKALKDVSTKLTQRIKTLNEKREGFFEKIERSKKTEKACLAYNKQEYFAISHEQRQAGKAAHKMSKIQEHEKHVRENLKPAEIGQKLKNKNKDKKD